LPITHYQKSLDLWQSRTTQLLMLKEVELTVSFKDYFSKQAKDYATYRPCYPKALFEYLAEIAPSRETAWDCGTGNGQVALSLTPYFQQIYATDASATQIAQAFPHERIQYQIATAERTELVARSIDLVTVGQALHWFNLEEFYQEVRRVVKPGGAIAVWCYGVLELIDREDPAHRVLQEFYTLMEPFWPAERELVRQRYQSIPFPFLEQTAPAFTMTAEWTVAALVGYLGTWSATQQFIKQHGDEEIATLSQRLYEAWGTPQSQKLIQWPLSIRVGLLS
ncbi:MAG TPA: hypothetical protein DC064_06240, partial [Cyanobacteria bacterium UBA9273]|nr:hypothetical protein [Cyanobacteria bacterium UBA9273]